MFMEIPDHWDHWHDAGPDFRAILVPDRDFAVQKVCGALGLILFAPTHRDYDGGAGTSHWEFSPALDPSGGAWHYWSPRKRCALPEFVPDVVAGASGPIQLTKWKVAALRIIAILELRGRVTRNDFKTVGIDPRRWTGPAGWLAPSDKPGEYLRGTGLDFDKQHPDVYAQVLAEARAKIDPAYPASLSGQTPLDLGAAGARNEA